MSNAFNVPINFSTGEIGGDTNPFATSTKDPSHSYTPMYAPASSGTNVIDNVTGFLTKTGERALDLWELYGRFDRSGDNPVTQGAARQNPSITESQRQAEAPRMAGIPHSTLYVVGGVIALTAITGVVILATRK